MRTRGGFTLVELMVVLVILGILATMVTLNATGYLHRADRTKVLADLRTLHDAVELWRIENKAYPDNSQGLSVLTAATDDHPNGLVSAIPKDPWDREYQYLYPGANGVFDIVTYGEDGVEGGEGANADIGNWELK